MSTAISDSVLDRVRAHAAAEGRADYEGRAGDVEAGQQPESWAWPFGTADEAYINAVTTDAIIREIGVDGLEWDDIADEWCAAFKRGYVAARGEAE